MIFKYHHDSRTFTAEIHRIGPTIEGEFYASRALGGTQSGLSGAVITKWEVDGPVECEPLTGTNADWNRSWQSFFATLPPGLAGAVASFEDSVRS
jgi:hypothetical protein